MGVVRVPNRRPAHVAQQPQRQPATRAYASSPRRAPTSSDRVALSILIPTVPSRQAKLTSLLLSLDAQAVHLGNVELIVLRDNRKMPIGEKRNKMLQLAHGDHVAFVDDDDAVAHDYAKSITDRLRDEDPDVLCFSVMVTGYGPAKICRYHPSLQHANHPNEYHRKPNHLMVWRRELALREVFPSISSGEDTAWADLMVKHISTVSVIDRVLYTYQYDPNDNSSTIK